MKTRNCNHSSRRIGISVAQRQALQPFKSLTVEMVIVFDKHKVDIK